MCTWIQMIIWCDHCLLVALWFRFHTELEKSPLFGSNSSNLIPKCERQKPHRTRRERSGAPHASLLYNLVVAWVVWNSFCLFVWHIVTTVMSSFWRYLFCGIALIAWPTIWPFGIHHCCVSYWFLGNASNGSRLPSLPRYISACRVLCDCNNNWYENIEWSLHLFQKEDKTIVYSWLTLKESAWPTVAFSCCFLSILFPVEISALWLV